MTGKRTSPNEDERAVSPVIGVILMVAITVILAAVIGTFVLDLGNDVGENVQAGASVSFDNSNDEFSVTWTSNQNAEHLNVSGSVNGSSYDGTLCDVGDKITWEDSGVRGDTSGSCIGNSATSVGFSDGDTVDVTVTAVKGESSTVVVDDTESEI